MAGILTSSSSSLFSQITIPTIPKRFVSFSLPTMINYPKLLSYCFPSHATRFCSVLALVGEETVVVGDEINREDNVDGNEVDGNVSVQDSKNRAGWCELYVFNLPRSYDIPELLEMFKPFGTVISVEVSKNTETVISRGCGYVTMGSINSGKNAIAALDGSDVNGREMLVRYSVDISSRKRNPEFGNVVSARVLHDRKGGTNRVFGFLSFSSVAERNAALSLNGTEFRGRRLIVREGADRTEP